MQFFGHLWKTGNYIRELGLKEAVYEDTFESLDLIQFSAVMRTLILQQVPPHQYGTLVSALNFLVALEAVTQQAARLVVDLGETEHLTGNRQCLNSGREVRSPSAQTRRLDPKVIQSAPIRVTRKELFKDLIGEGIQFKKIDSFIRSYYNYGDN